MDCSCCQGCTSAWPPSPSAAEGTSVGGLQGGAVEGSSHHEDWVQQPPQRRGVIRCYMQACRLASCSVSEITSSTIGEQESGTSGTARQGLTCCLTAAAWQCCQAEDPETQQGTAAAAALKHLRSVCGTPMRVRGTRWLSGLAPVQCARQQLAARQALLACAACTDWPTCELADKIWLVKEAGSAGLASVLGVMNPSLSYSLLLPPGGGCTCIGEGRNEWRHADTCTVWTGCRRAC